MKEKDYIDRGWDCQYTIVTNTQSKIQLIQTYKVKYKKKRLKRREPGREG